MVDKNKRERIFSPLYLAIFSGIILTILIVNGLLEISRTKKGFYRLLEREALALIQHFEKNIKDTISSLQSIEKESVKLQSISSTSEIFLGIEESLAEYLLDIIHSVDRMDGEKPMAPSDLQAFIEQYLISSIEIYDDRGNLLRGWPRVSLSSKRGSLLKELIVNNRSTVIDLFDKPLSEDQWFSIGIRRKTAPGIILLYLNGEQVKILLRQFLLQRAISDVNLREGIIFISILDINLNYLAHTNPYYIGRREDDPFLKDSFKNKKNLSRIYHLKGNEEVFEVVKSIYLKEKPIGLIRIGYSLGEINTLLDQIKKNVALSIFFLLILGILATVLIWVNQNRHLRRMKEMEDRISRAERLSSLGHLAAGVAHEIRNPLNAMSLGLQSLKKEFIPDDRSKRDEYISFTEVILKEIRRINDIIEQFLSLARPFELRLKGSSLKDLLNHLITLFHEEASSKGIDIKLKLNSELPPIKMDYDKLMQSFTNIMKNGIEAMEKGGVLQIEAQSFKDYLDVTFSDSGSGIPQDQMERIFNYYYTTKEKGVGLGLPISHRIIEAHGGEMKIESKLGAGTKVTVRLPISK